MALVIGDETTQSLTADGTTYSPSFVGRTVGGQASEVVMSGLTNKKIAALAAAHRSTVSSADSADCSSASGAKDIGSSMQVECHVRFSAASQSCVGFLALYDIAGTLIGKTENVTFAGSATYTDGTLYLSPRYIFDVGVAAQVLFKCVTPPSSGSFNVYVEGM